MILQLFGVLASLVLGQPEPAKAPSAGPFHVIRTIELGGEGGWDCVTVDPETHRLFIPRGTRVMVVDASAGKLIGEIPDAAGVHGVALAPEFGKGFTSNGRTNDVTVFDLKTFKPEKTIKAGQNPDVIIYEPTTKRVFCFNGKSNDATVISAADLSVVGTIALGGKPEFAVFDGQGKVFVNIEDTSELVRLDAKSLAVEKRMPLAPGEEPSGLAIDRASRRLFAACHNEMMVVVDAETGKVVAQPPIGKGVDGAEFDSVGGYALSSNGEGTLTVIGKTADSFSGVVQTLATARGARTMTIDPKARLIFLPTAEFEAPAAGEEAPKRPKMKPGTFKVLVVGA